MAAAETIRWERDGDVVVLTFDDPARAANTMSREYVAAMEATLERLEAEREGIAGVVLASAKRTFFAGGDLDELLAVDAESAGAYADHVRLIKAQLRRLETLGVPVVAAIGGAALGGGLEIALAAHHRIAVDDERIRLGFPEVTLGLMPGAGGVVRSVRMLGIEPALDRLLLDGRPVDPRRARELGLVDQLVGPEDLLAAAKAWIAAGPEPTQPWDREGYEIPGGGADDPALAPTLLELPARLTKKLRGANYPAPHAILAAAVEGTQVDFESAIEIEGRYFVSLVTDQTAKNMIQAFFFDLERVRGDRGRAGAERFEPRKAVVLGAGMMGAGIAWACARVGIEVVLKDIDLAAAERGKAYSERLVAKEVERGRRGTENAAALLDRIHPTADAADAAGADLLIEAVFEDPALKAEAYREIEPHLAEGALLASNTSTLPITGLAAAVTRPADFIGLHFFSPVDKMALLEIVVGEATSEETVGRALDVARALGKTPIVVNDSRGFFTSRVIAYFYDEGLAMLAEGVPPASIEQASAQAGYPAPVLQLADELNLNLIRRVRDENRAAAGFVRDHPGDPVVDRMLDEFERGGRAAGAGFYEYEDGRRARLWPGLAAFAGDAGREIPPLAELGERMLFVEALEAVRAYEAGVIESVADANIGSILGIGFPRWTGGVLQYVNGYPGGPAGFLARAEEFEAAHGERFAPPHLLRTMVAEGRSFADAEVEAAAP
jgi:3-hydroxyacyl-CoA dehydrogenase / enoyl-CoA hydratase / 3-hydroxybutyryl-CoA epimerase